MIKIERGCCPSELTDDEVRRLTNEFKLDNNKRVWDKPYLKEALFSLFHGKCCYCETLLKEESKYLTVDHFHPKDAYPDEVVKWENLLPCCSRCNSNKGTHDTYKYPIINPSCDNVKEFLYINAYAYESRDNNELGRMTKDVLGLNASEELVRPRFYVGEAIREKLSEIYENVIRYKENISDVRAKNKIVRGITDILRFASPEKQYSALAATIIVENDDYMHIKEKMLSCGLWSDEIKTLEDYAKNVSLSKC